MNAIMQQQLKAALNGAPLPSVIPSIKKDDFCKKSFNFYPGDLCKIYLTTPAIKFTYIEHKVHKLILRDSDYLVSKSKKISRAIRGIAGLKAEMPKQEFVGHLAKKLDAIPEVEPLYKTEAKLIAAAIIYELLVINGQFQQEVEEQFKKFEGKSKVITHYKLKTDGEAVKKELLRGIERQPGVFNQKFIKNARRTTAADKADGRAIASMPFVVSDVCTAESLNFAYSLTKAFNYMGKNESFDKKMKRYDLYRDTIMEVAGWDEFYLPVEFETSGRMHYECFLEGMRPHGKQWELNNIDAADYRFIGEEGLHNLMHIIYCMKYNTRVTLQYAIDNFKDEYVDWAAELNPMGEDVKYDGTNKAIKLFGDRTYLNKAAKAYRLTEQGFPTNYLFGKDLTNSGLIMFANSFGEHKTLVKANSTVCDDVHDTHDDLAQAQGIARADAKLIGHLMYHGGTYPTMVSDLAKHGVTVTEESLLKGAVDAYGECIKNILTIGAWGSHVLDNDHTLLTWTLPDGFVAAYRSYVESNPVEMTVVSATNKTGFSNLTVVTDTPMVLQAPDHNGVCYSTVPNGKGKGVHSKNGAQNHLIGLYAVMTHSIDAYLLRQVRREVIKRGVTMIFKHDNYISYADILEIVLKVAQDFLLEIRKENLYVKALREIAVNAPCKPKLPALVLNQMPLDKVEAENFLMP